MTDVNSNDYRSRSFVSDPLTLGEGEDRTATVERHGLVTLGGGQVQAGLAHCAWPGFLPVPGWQRSKCFRNFP